jgi:uncharacterized protein
VKQSTTTSLTASLILLLVLSIWIGSSRQRAIDQTRPQTSVVGPPPPDIAHITEAIVFDTSDGVTLRGWYLAPPNAKAAIVLLHGHGYDRYAMLKRARWLVHQGYACLVYDARGHGESDAVRVTIGYREREDLLAAAAWLRARGWPTFVAIGFSQGAVAILEAANDLPGLRGAVLESPFDTLGHHAARTFAHRLPLLPGAWTSAWYTHFLRKRLELGATLREPLACAADLPCPSWFIAGGQDPYSPPADVHLLYDHAPEPRHFSEFKTVGHGDFYQADPERYTSELKAFLDVALESGQEIPARP